MVKRGRKRNEDVQIFKIYSAEKWKSRGTCKRKDSESDNRVINIGY